MIRHGLVHQSPGYVCPFCPDREHKYPRPDNLQRCVIVLALSTEIELMHVVGMYAYTIPIKIKMTRNFVMSLLSGLKAVVGGGEDALATLAIDSVALPRSALDVL
jgi:hypothetical protein